MKFSAFDISVRQMLNNSKKGRIIISLTVYSRESVAALKKRPGQKEKMNISIGGHGLGGIIRTSNVYKKNPVKSGESEQSCF